MSGIGEERKLLSVSYNPEYESVSLRDIGMDTIKELLSGEDAIGDAIVYWQSADKMDFGMWKDGELLFRGYQPQWKHLRELRVFNQASELHAWRNGGEFSVRYIKGEETDAKTDGQSGNCLVQSVKLWGTLATKEDTFIVLREDRGMEISLPCKWEDRFKDGINAFLRERLYIKEDESGCAYFHDRRFCWVSIADKNGVLHDIELCELEVSEDEQVYQPICIYPAAGDEGDCQARASSEVAAGGAGARASGQPSGRECTRKSGRSGLRVCERASGRACAQANSWATARANARKNTKAWARECARARAVIHRKDRM